jgi:hypothetical protein
LAVLFGKRPWEELRGKPVFLPDEPSSKKGDRTDASSHERGGEQLERF